MSCSNTQTTRGCGCAADPCAPPTTRSCDEPGCGLVASRRPRFFKGQLLAEESLNHILEWSATRDALQRYRTGWGAVCGLQVVTHPTSRDRVIVRLGYAVDSCGRDVIVPCDTDLSLEDLCPRGVDDCSQSDEPRPEVAIACPPIACDDLVSVDVFLHYGERLDGPQPSLGSGGCGDGPECDYTETRESFRLEARPASDQSLEQLHAAWIETYLECFSWTGRFWAYDDAGTVYKNLPLIRGWLLERMKLHPPQTFAWVRDCICELDADRLSPEEALQLVTRIFFFLIQDCRNKFFARGCAAGDPCAGVPLARVRLRPSGNRRCEIVEIDGFTPYRREWGPATATVPLGQTELGPWIWQDCRRLCELRSSVRFEVREWSPESPAQVLRSFFLPGGQQGSQVPVLREVLSSWCEDRIVAHCMDAGCYGSRVVFFSGPLVGEGRESVVDEVAQMKRPDLSVDDQRAKIQRMLYQRETMEKLGRVLEWSEAEAMRSTRLRKLVDEEVRDLKPAELKKHRTLLEQLRKLEQHTRQSLAVYQRGHQQVARALEQEREALHQILDAEQREEVAARLREAALDARVAEISFIPTLEPLDTRSLAEIAELTQKAERDRRDAAERLEAVGPIREGLGQLPSTDEGVVRRRMDLFRRVSEGLEMERKWADNLVAKLHENRSGVGDDLVDSADKNELNRLAERIAARQRKDG